MFSCSDNFFDTVPEDRLTLEETFQNEALTNEYLANVYSYVPDEFSQRFLTSTSGQWTAGSSEAEYVWSFVPAQLINSGAMDPSSSLTSQYWTEYYKGISKASTFIQKVDECKEMQANTRLVRKAEARALRAYYYFNLMKIYGPVVLLGETPISSDASLDEVQLSRSSIDDCVKYIVNELAVAAQDLPEAPLSNTDYGRMTKPIVLAIRSQVFLYAASPLFNGNTDYAALKNEDGTQLFPQTYDAAKWDSARVAAKKFIDLYVPNMYSLYRVGTDGKTYTGTDGQLYDPYISYRETVRGEGFDNPEMIFYRIQCNASYFQYEETPFHSGAPSNEYKGSGGKSATQEIVDLYFTKNGLRIDDDATYAASGMSTASYKDPFLASRVFAPINTYKPWTNREPRFYADITFNNSVWLKTDPSKITTTTYFNGNSGKNVGGNDYPVTGYIVRKGAPLGDWQAGGRSCILMRLAEIYLNYAEAANECGYADEAIKYVNLIRQRAGVPEYGTGTDSNGFARIAYPNTKEDIRNRIRRERTVELAFENQRFFDVRRWKVADMATGDGWVYPTYHLGGEGGDYHGMNISQDPPKFFNTVVFESRTFSPKHYFFPVPQSEINIDSKLVQTTGWETTE